MDDSSIKDLMSEIKSIRHEFWNVDDLIPYPNNPRKNDHLVDSMAARIIEFGMPVPICIRPDGSVVDGHLRLKAVKKLGLPEVPVAINETWTPEKIKAFRLSVNKTAELADWDFPLLSVELDDLREAGFDMDLIGFTPAELNELLGVSNSVDDHSGEWTGMPEFDQKDKTAFRSIIVHFSSQDNVDMFQRMVNQNITESTKFIWYPNIEIETAADKRYGGA